MYDPCAKRHKLKPTDRRPTVNVTTASDDESTGDDCVKPPQTIDDMRRIRNRRTQTARPVLKPYVGKRTAATVEDDYRQHDGTMPQECHNSSAAITAANCITSTSHSKSTSCGRVQPVHGANHSSNVQKCVKNERAHSADASRLPQERLMKYVTAIGSEFTCSIS